MFYLFIKVFMEHNINHCAFFITQGSIAKDQILNTYIIFKVAKSAVDLN